MNINKIYRNATLILAIALAITGCKKLDRPELGDYPKDLNPPGGPLKFYAALDGGRVVDSIRANFGIEKDITYVDGVSGKAAKFDIAKKGNIVFPSANDFGTQTDITVSMWINAGTIAMKDADKANGVIAFGNTSNFWGNLTVFIESEKSRADSMFLKVVLGGEFVTYEGTKRIPRLYDNKWHHMAYTYQPSDSSYKFFVDGALYDQRTLPKKAVFKEASVFVVGGFQQAASIQGTYADNTWMSPFTGAIDQVRLYGKLLSPTEITQLYTSKL